MTWHDAPGRPVWRHLLDGGEEPGQRPSEGQKGGYDRQGSCTAILVVEQYLGHARVEHEWDVDELQNGLQEIERERALGEVKEIKVTNLNVFRKIEANKSQQEKEECHAAHERKGWCRLQCSNEDSKYEEYKIPWSNPTTTISK